MNAEVRIMLFRYLIIVVTSLMKLGSCVVHKHVYVCPLEARVMHCEFLRVVGFNAIGRTDSRRLGTEPRLKYKGGQLHMK